MKIIVSSQNPVKIEASRRAFQKMFPKDSFTIKSVNVSSDVPDQPNGTKQTIEGSKNRIKNAKNIVSQADYYVGIEGGIIDEGETMDEICWASIENREGKQISATSGGFRVPPVMAQIVRSGEELGTAGNIILQKENVKQTTGLIGEITDGVFDRTTYIETALIFALAPFKNPQLYATTNPQPTTHNPQPTTYNPQPTTHNYQVTSNNEMGSRVAE